MDSRGTWKIRRHAADGDLPGDTETVDPANPDVAEENLDNPLPLNPEVEAPVIGRFAYMNDLMVMATNPKNQAMSLPSDVLNQIRQDVAMTFGMSYATGDPLSQLLIDVDASLALAGDNPKDGLHASRLDSLYEQMKSKYAQGNQELEGKFDAALALSKVSASGQDAQGKAISNEFARKVTVQLSSPNKQQMQASTWRIRTTKVSQNPDPLQAQPLNDNSDPLSTQPFQSLNDLKTKIVEMGRPQEGESSQDSIKRIYEKVFDMVGPEHEDRAKAALKSLYQFGVISELWSLFQEIGLAAPIDQEVIGEIMQTNPDLFNQEKETAKAAGLFLPDPSKGLYTMPEAGLTKTASGGVGGAGAGYPAYEYEGSNRMCPKIRGVVNTFICRYHCLDGLKIDDAQVLCGEALWRQAVMDKFSREYKNEDGEWVGGYLNKRFEIHRDDGGHPYQLKPGRRSAPLHEEAWSHEKRLVEMRKSEGAKRGYGPVSGERDDLYNFDQHKLLGGPKSSTLDAKKRDTIAKNASSSGTTRVAFSGDPEHPNMGIDPREGQDAGQFLPEHANQPMTEADVNEMILAGKAEQEDFQRMPNGMFMYKAPQQLAASKWSIKTAEPTRHGPRGFGKGHAPDCECEQNFTCKQCLQTSVDQNTADANTTPWVRDSKPYGYKEKKDEKKAFNLRRIAVDNGNPLMDGIDMGDKAKECTVCRKKFALEYKGNCDNVQSDALGNRRLCGGQLRTLDDGTIKEMTGAIDTPEFDLNIKASKDIEVRYAAGVFVASSMGKRAYGESPSQAVEKLAFQPSPGFASGKPEQPEPAPVDVEELEQELRYVPEEQEQEQVQQEQEPVATVDVTPTTEDVPMSEAPENPFEEMASDARPLPDPAKIEAAADPNVPGQDPAEGDTPAEKKRDQRDLDALFGF